MFDWGQLHNLRRWLTDELLEEDDGEDWVKVCARGQCQMITAFGRLEVGMV